MKCNQPGCNRPATQRQFGNGTHWDWCDRHAVAEKKSELKYSGGILGRWRPVTKHDRPVTYTTFGTVS